LANKKKKELGYLAQSLISESDRKLLIDGGFDGIKGEGGVWIALNPNQIKSAIGNSGAFDPANPDIRASVTRDRNLAGRKVSYDVRIEDTGETATLTVDAKEATEDYNSRVETMRKLLGCLGK
jgi:hypothetical protein